MGSCGTAAATAWGFPWPHPDRLCPSAGVRLEPPEQCPDEVYRVMQCCWEYDSRQRPSFSTIHQELIAIRRKLR